MSNEETDCQLYNYQLAGYASVCAYVRNNSDVCDGGGYLAWTELLVCAESVLLKALASGGALLFFLLLFLHLSITADSFFCKSIASIVDKHKISQNIAGITFMAFGNGAPDIFSSLATVISLKKPRADLAISELLGGGIFVTTCVLAGIALTRPFLLMRRPILRDIAFFLAALLLLFYVALSEGLMPLWQPLAFLLLYLLYALTFLSGNFIRHKMPSNGKSTKLYSAFTWLMPKRVVPEEEMPKRKSPKENGVEKPNGGIVREVQAENGKIALQKSTPNVAAIAVPEDGARKFSAEKCQLAGKFFGKEELDAEVEDAAQLAEDDEGEIDEEQRTSNLGGELLRFLRLLSPLDGEKFWQANWPSRIYRILKIPSLFLLNLTVPCPTRHWSKPMAILHAFFAPLLFCLAFQLFSQPMSHGLYLWEFALALSILLSILIILLTTYKQEPKYYKWVVAYAGFVLSIAWIYATAAEVLNVVLMFGNLLNIPYPILGLTAISWSNSIGDLIADISVARQGMPRMAFSAAIGSPLFNLMIGFGATFTLAKIQAKDVLIRPSPVNRLMIVFAGLSLLLTLGLLILRKFYVSRMNGVLLLGLYFIFIVCAILTQSGIFAEIF